MYEIKGSPLTVDTDGIVYKDGVIFDKVLIRIGKEVSRVKALIVNTFILNGRYDLLSVINKPVYRITNPNGGIYWTINLAEFCKDENLSYDSMRKALYRGGKTRNNWTVELIK